MAYDPYNVAKLNERLARVGLMAEFVLASDESVDDEIMLYVESHAEPIGGVQIESWGQGFCANCWADAKQTEMAFSEPRNSLNIAVRDAIHLLRKYGWIK